MRTSIRRSTRGGEKVGAGAPVLIVVVSLGLLLAAGGCGSSSGRSAGATSSGTTRGSAVTPGGAPPPPAAEPPRQSALLKVTTAARNASGVLETRYTCRGADVSPPVRWARVPASAQELVVMVTTLAGSGPQTSWVVAGISPQTNGIAQGALPPGAIVGRNSFGTVGYHVCPPTDKPGLVVVDVYAMPRKLSLRRGFRPRELRPVIGESPFGFVASRTPGSAARRG